MKNSLLVDREDLPQEEDGLVSAMKMILFPQETVGIAGCTTREFPTGLTTSGDSDEDSGELIPSLQGNSGC